IRKLALISAVSIARLSNNASFSLSFASKMCSGLFMSLTLCSSNNLFACPKQIGYAGFQWLHEVKLQMNRSITTCSEKKRRCLYNVCSRGADLIHRPRKRQWDLSAPPEDFTSTVE